MIRQIWSCTTRHSRNRNVRYQHIIPRRRPRPSTMIRKITSSSRLDDGLFKSKNLIGSSVSTVTTTTTTTSPRRRFFASVQDSIPSNNDDDNNIITYRPELGPPGGYEITPTTTTVSRRDFIIESFAKQTIDNVNGIINFLETKQTKKGRNINLSRKWQKVLKFERKAYYYRLNSHNKTMKSTMSIEELWDEALDAANIPFLEKSSLLLVQEEEPSSSVSQEEKSESTETYIDLINRDDGENDTIILSPILGLNLDENGRIVKIDDDDDSLLFDDDDDDDEEEINGSITDLVEGFVLPNKNGEKNQQDAILRAIALLSASTVDEWDVFDSRHQQGSGEELNNDDDDEEEISKIDLGASTTVTSTTTTTTVGIIDELLTDMENGKYTLTTKESNLLLAQLVTSMDLSVDAILNQSLHLFEQMKTLSYSGREESGPDVYTFRILMTALSRRLMATGEALKLCDEILDSPAVEFTPEAFLNCTEICFTRNDLTAATKLLNTVIERDSSFRPPIDSYIRIIEMMKKQNLQTEAFDLLKQTQQMNSLNNRDEGKLLSCLCHWPVRSRRGDLIDTAPLLLKISNILDERSRDGKVPEHQIWTTLVDQLSQQAKSCKSHWKDVNKILKSFFALYPNFVPDKKLLKTCLEAGESTLDASIAATAIERETDRDQIINSEVPGDDDNNTPVVAPVPQGVFRRALEICLRCNDTKNANRILDSFETCKEVYPVKVQSDIFGLVLLCYAKVGQAEKAKTALFTMIDRNMEPSEDLHGAVLHSLVVDNKRDEAMEIFQQMGREDTGLTLNPGVSCYNAILLSHIRSQSWDDAILLHQAMIEKDISSSPQTVQGLVLATYKTGGRVGVLSLLENLLAGDSKIDERTFLLVARVLLPFTSTGTTDDLRKLLRKLGDSNESLKRFALELTRSLRTAQVEQHRQVSKHQVIVKENDAWRSALSHLLNLVRESSFQTAS